MGLHHLLNCALLAYAPYVITYKSTSLDEDKMFGACVVAALSYVVTQLTKMILVATFLGNFGHEEFTFTQEAFIFFAHATDLIGIHKALQKVKKDTKSKTMAVGLGWACSDALFTCALPIAFAASGTEFRWETIYMCVDVNVRFLRIMTLTALTWMTTTAMKTGAGGVPLLSFLLVVLMAQQNLTNILRIQFKMGEVPVLGVSICMAISLAVWVRWLFRARVARPKTS